ncbi:MAG: citryl-CoA lyase [Patescibacteria group bacterium]
MIWKTALSTITNGKEIIRGYPLEDLIKNRSFAEVIFLLWKGKLPTAKEAQMFDALFVACIDHGVGAPSATVVRTVASTGNSMHTALAAGVATLGELHGGAVEASARFFTENLGQNIPVILKIMKDQKIRLPGFGHRVLSHDNRTDVLFAMAKETGFFGKYCTLAMEVTEKLNEGAKKEIPLNIDGAMAAIILDMGFDAEIAKGFFLVGRVPGLIAHIYEEKKSGEGMRRISEEDIVYTGEKS